MLVKLEVSTDILVMVESEASEPEIASVRVLDGFEEDTMLDEATGTDAEPEAALPAELDDAEAGTLPLEDGPGREATTLEPESDATWLVELIVTVEERVRVLVTYVVDVMSEDGTLPVMASVRVALEPD